MADCSNTRIATLIDRILAVFNDTSKNFLSEAEILLFLNRVHERVASYNYWKKLDTINVVADQYTYDLLDAFSDYEFLMGLEIYLEEEWWPLRVLPDFADMKRLHSGLSPYREPYLPDYPNQYSVDSNVLYVWPTPTENITDGWQVYYSYMPADVTCDVDYELPLPRAHNDLYVYGALAFAYEKDRHAPLAAQQGEKYRGLYEQALQKLILKYQSPLLHLSLG